MTNTTKKIIVQIQKGYKNVYSLLQHKVFSWTGKKQLNFSWTCCSAAVMVRQRPITWSSKIAHISLEIQYWPAFAFVLLFLFVLILNGLRGFITFLWLSFLLFLHQLRYTICHLRHFYKLTHDWCVFPIESVFWRLLFLGEQSVLCCVQRVSNCNLERYLSETKGILFRVF